jgi:hypothetical protein
MFTDFGRRYTTFTSSEESDERQGRAEACSKTAGAAVMAR